VPQGASAVYKARDAALAAWDAARPAADLTWLTANNLNGQGNSNNCSAVDEAILTYSN
jgi:hypothetical protein